MKPLGAIHNQAQSSGLADTDNGLYRANAFNRTFIMHSPLLDAPNPNRLLVLDDEPAILSLVRRMGERIGYETTCVSAFDGFIKQFRDVRPSVVLLDLILQQEDALRVVEFMGQKRFSGGLILFSGYDYRILRSIAEVARSHGLHVMGTVEKGLNMDKVSAILRTAYLGGLPADVSRVG